MIELPNINQEQLMKKQTLFILILSLCSVSFSFVAQAITFFEHQVLILRVNFDTLRQYPSIDHLIDLRKRAENLRRNATTYNDYQAAAEAQQLAHDITEILKTIPPEGSYSSRRAHPTDDRAVEY